jgi:uncharacterized membrane protein
LSTVHSRWGFRTWLRILFGIGFILAGANHFISAPYYVAMMPPYLPLHQELVYISGISEMGLGAMVMLDYKTVLAAWGLIALLIAVYPANIHMALNPQLYPNIPAWALYARLPFQFLFIGIAYWLTRSK